MRKFVINVNGKSYEVEVEEVGGASTSVSYAAPKAAPAAPAAAPVAAAQTPSGATTINAPMPGTVVSIKVNVGDTVKAGDVVCILEAMKMENEIMAPSDGKIVAVNTTQGASVNTGDALVSMG